MAFSHNLPSCHSFSHLLLFLLWQVGSEMAISGKAVSLYFEEKLQEIFPGQSFPETAEPESPQEKEKEDDNTDDSEDDFIQPRRKRLKTDEKVVHIKWDPHHEGNERSEKLPSSYPTLLFGERKHKKQMRDSVKEAWFISSLAFERITLNYTRLLLFWELFTDWKMEELHSLIISWTFRFAWKDFEVELVLPVVRKRLFLFYHPFSYVDLLWQLLYKNKETPCSV